MTIINMSIDATTRQISMPSNVSIEQDNTGQVIQFSIADYTSITDKDITLIYANYITSNGTGDKVECTDIAITDGTLTFNWTVPYGATYYSGNCAFNIWIVADDFLWQSKAAYLNICSTVSLSKLSTPPDAEWTASLTNKLSELITEVESVTTDVTTLQTDVTAAEATIATLQEDVTTANADTATLQTNVDAATTTMETLQTDLNTASTNIAALQATIDTAEGDTSILQTTVDGLQATVNTLQTDVSEAQTTLDALNVDIVAAQTAATTATEQATIATTAAATATEKAEIATTAADSASTSATNAATSETNAATSATSIADSAEQISTNATNIATNTAIQGALQYLLIPLFQSDTISTIFPYYKNKIFRIPITAGLMDFSITNGDNVLWVFPDGTTSTDDHPAVTLTEDGTVLLFCTNFSDGDIMITDGVTNADYVGDLSDLPNLTNYASFSSCIKLTGDISALSNLTYYASFSSCIKLTGDISVLSSLTNTASFYSCTNLTGDISALSNLTYYADFYNCTNLTGDISALSNLTYYARFSSCTNLTGILNPNAKLSYLNLGYTGLSSSDVDQTVINLNTNTTVTGTLIISGLTRTSASTDAINRLIAKGWTVTDATIA